MPFYFEDYVLDPGRGELSRGGVPIKVEPKVFDLLVFLVENRDRLVTKDDLIAHVWDGRIVSDSALASAINAARKAIGDSGQEQRLVGTSARKGFRFLGAVTAGRLDARPDEAVNGIAAPSLAIAPPHVPLPRVPLPQVPSIAVLPFQNLSADPEQEYFADGMVEDITTALSHFKSLFVIARNSSFTYKGKTIDIKRVGRELGVRYVLEGSVRKSADHMRLSGQLIESERGTHIWAESFDGCLADVFALQDKITAQVVGAMVPKLDRAEMARATRKPVERLDAYDCFLRGMASIQQWNSRASIEETLRLFYQAIDLDPQFSTPYGMATRCYGALKIQGWLNDQEATVVETRRLAARVSQIGHDDARALSNAGLALVWICRDFEAGEEMVDLALAQNPNLASAWQSRAQVSLYLGKHEEAIEQVSRVLRLSPLDPEIARSHSILAYANLLLHRYDESLKWTALVLSRQPKSHLALRTAMMAHALSGNEDEARRLAARMSQLDPDIRLSRMKDFLPYRRPEDIELLVDALRRAGLPP